MRRGVAERACPEPNQIHEGALKMYCEAEITCICRSIHIPDMSQTLVKGEVIYVDAGIARGSKDLAHAQKVYGVTVRYVKWCAVERDAPVPAPAPAPASRMPERPRMVFPEVSPAPVVVSDLDALGAVVRKEVGSALLANLGPLMKKALADHLLTVVTAAPTVVAAIPSDMPRFIPSDVGGADLKGEIIVTTREGAVPEVGEAAAALRSARGRKRKVVIDGQ